MTTNAVCAACGQALPADAPQGRCPDCLFGLLDGPEAARSAGSSPGSEDGPASRLFGDYELLEQIGRGGMGVVYKARQTSLGRIVAVKMLLGAQFAAKELVQRFRAEAGAAAALRHPNIVAIYDVGVHHGQHYFSMDYVPGQNLSQLIRTQPLAPKEAARYVEVIAEAIEYAHSQGILHRDLKPSNVLVDTAMNEPRVTDFGLAKRLDEQSSLTLTGQVLGSPNFMPPEQASPKHGKIGRQSDVYALGGILFFLLTARAPFQGETLESTIDLLLNSEAVSPRSLNPGVPRDLETICLKCLEKDPLKRYQTARGLAEELGRFLNDEPLEARPVSQPERVWRWVRRNPARTTALAAVLSFAAALGVITWQAVTSRKEADAKPLSLGIIFRPEDANSAPLAKEWSRDLNHFFHGLSGINTLERSQVLRWETDATAPPQKIGQSLGVRALLLGRVRDSDARVEVDLELVTFPDQTRIWTHSFTQSADDWPYTRSQIGREVILGLGRSPTDADQTLLRRPTSRNAAAEKEYNRGRRDLDALSDAGLTSAISHFEAAIALDPRYAQAHAGLAEACISLTSLDHAPAPLLAKAHAAILRALEIDPRLPEAKFLDGVWKYCSEWDWIAAQRALAEALRTDLSVIEGNTCYLHLLDVEGKGKEALEAVKRAVSLHPTSLLIQTERGCAAYYAELFVEGEAFARESVQNDPENAYVYFLLARILAQEHKYEDALKTLELARAKPGGDGNSLESERAYIYSQTGEREKAVQILDQLKQRARGQYVDPYIFAMIHAGLGEAAEMFKELEQACDAKSTWIASLVVEPKFIRFRNDPRFAALLRKLNMPLLTSSSVREK
jgi:serine/threonine protein kinase/tetratricopeptide (TPR) repeat protein